MMMMAAGARMEEEFGVVFAAFISPLAVGGNAFTIDENAKRQWSWFLYVGRSNAMHRRARWTVGRATDKRRFIPSCPASRLLNSQRRTDE